MAGFRKNSEPTPLADVLAGLLKKRLAPDARLSRIWEAWESLAGPEMASHARPASIKKGILFVTVDSAPMAQELSYRKRELKKSLNQALGADLVVDVRFKVGVLPKTGPGEK
ncbi:MAG: DUF721 domain-containing protein [Proteobacteria bacterium]|nr:DUF721 domain-containing protein [Pseudomonadota bacterium]